VGTVVVTTGTTGVGAVDRVDEVLALRERYGVRVHVDAAYGGFYTLLAGAGEDGLGAAASAAFRAIASCDSVVVDPHKHGLQPYGCGAVLFADPAVGALYRHDSPYTYFTSDELHLGEISLECSRAGAAAAALWLTLQVFPLRGPEQAGLGAMLAACRRAALGLADALRDDDALALLLEPELDIVVYHPRRGSLPAVDAASAAMLAAGMAPGGDDPVFVSALRVGEALFPAVVARDGADGARVLRSVLMKPEHELHVDWLAGRLRELAAGVPA
jgi:glutamate/tyrosine decarboxylase-like PLP-dependent enzyme